MNFWTTLRLLGAAAFLLVVLASCFGADYDATGPRGSAPQAQPAPLLVR